MVNDEYNEDFTRLVEKTMAEKMPLVYGVWAVLATSLCFAYLLGKKRGAKTAGRYPFHHRKMVLVGKTVDGKPIWY